MYHRPHMRIVVGSTRPAKVEAARAAVNSIARLDERFHQATVLPIDLTDIAPTMPMTERAILDGACLRAQTLFARASSTLEAQLAIGVEGGLDPLPIGGQPAGAENGAPGTDGGAPGELGGGAATSAPSAL